MVNFSTLPQRQKILIGLTVIIGLILIISSMFKLMPQDTQNNLILFYSIGVPLFLLGSDTIIDLNNRDIFTLWFTIAIIMFIVSLVMYNSDNFIIQRSSNFHKTSGVNSLISDHSTSALKALLIFLLIYFILNNLYAKKGVYIINTMRQSNWYHEIAKRKITGLDVAINLLLAGVIIAAGLFGH